MIDGGFLSYIKAMNPNFMDLGLSSVKKLLGRLGNPESHFPSILIGGTNGKGSVAAFLFSILKKSGLTVGLYTSPHLVSFNERIRIGEFAISDEEIELLGSRILPFINDEITFFEAVTALAFLCFQEHSVDIAILEVGMGGRFDATNVVNPEVSVITNVSREHQAYLGKTLPLIAREKGGIIKEGGTTVTGARRSPVIRTLKEISEKREARLLRLGSDFHVRSLREGTFSYYGLERTIRNLSTTLCGRHQIDNAVVALATLEVLSTKGFPVDYETLPSGVLEAVWPGRMEIVRRDPTVVLDGAHNPAAVAVIARGLQETFTFDELIVVFGVLQDKDYPSMLKQLSRVSRRIIVTEPPGERAADTSSVAAEAARYFAHVHPVPVPTEAVRCAISEAGSGDLVAVIGSLHLIGDIKKNLFF